MEFLYEYGLFLAKAITIVAALLVVLVVAMGAAMRNHKKSAEGDLIIENVNETMEETEDLMLEHLLDKKAYKIHSKQKKHDSKDDKKNKDQSRKKTSDTHELIQSSSKNPRLFVIDFEGDVQVTEIDQLINTIDAALLVAQPGDEFLCTVESPGGLVHAYGLAASQLKRIRDAGFKLTIAVDKVAASGGYMMACVADRIIAAPFSIIGSIGVVAQIPNFNKILQKNNVDIELHTAGEYKRTLTMFGENTDEGRAKFQEELEETHVLFKTFVFNNRPNLDIAQVATGEHWYGEQAINLGLIDEISTSQSYLMKAVKDYSVFRLKFEKKVPLTEKLGFSLSRALTRVLHSVGLGNPLK